jgi:membrane protease YdiL (CAAX protease family)
MASSLSDSQAPSSPVKRLMVLHPVTSYFVLAYAGTWLLLLPMVLSSDGLGLMRFSVPFPIYAALFLLSSFAGPTLSAVVVTDVLEGRAGLGRFFRRYVQWRVGVFPYLFVFVLYPLIWLVAAVVPLSAASLRSSAAHPLTYFTVFLPALLIFPAIITWGEEPGWRGFALTRLQAQYSPIPATLIVGLFHGLWHLPVFLLVGGPAALGPFNLIRFLENTLLIMVIAIIWTWVFNVAGESILIAVLVHASNNASQAWVGSLIPNTSPAAGYVEGAIFVGIALVVILTTWGRLGYRSQQTGTPRVAA